MKKFFASAARSALAMALAGAMVIGLAGCGSSGSSAASSTTAAPAAGTEAAAPAADGKKETINLTIGSAHSARTLDYMESLDDFFKPEVSKRVAERTNYEINWTDAYGTVVSASETVSGCRDGLVDLVAVFVAASAGEIPLHNFCYILPFACADTKMCLDVTRQLFKDYQPELVDSLETEFNQKLLSILIQPGYEIFSSSPITTAADLDGKKIGGSGRNLLWLEGTGAIPVQANMTEAYTSLQTSLIQGTIQAPYWGLKAKFQDVTGYMTNIGLGCNSGVLLTANLDKWNSLPAEVQEIITEVATELEEVQAEHAAETTAYAYEECEKAGLEITEMTEEEKAAWVNMLPNLPDTAAELGSKGVEILEHYVELLSEAGYEQPRKWEFNY
ncbi:MAG: TRAP transporter substrate-binding protein DctP [Lachnospiraceae bacterium]|nr:TRAP transporter substrate-binding protein DctP [Lachnospiraceae bacterium]